MKKKSYVLSSALWLAFFCTLLGYWAVYIEPYVNWRLAVRNWSAPLLALTFLVCLWVTFASLPTSDGRLPIFGKITGNLAGVGVLASGVGFAWSWGEATLHRINMINSGLGGAIALVTLAMFIAFAREIAMSLKQMSRPLEPSSAED